MWKDSYSFWLTMLLVPVTIVVMVPAALADDNKCKPMTDKEYRARICALRCMPNMETCINLCAEYKDDYCLENACITRCVDTQISCQKKCGAK